VAGSQQAWQVLRRWRDHSRWWLPRAALLAVLAALAGMVWWRWGLAGLAVAGCIALVGGLILWVVVMPSRLAPPVPVETLNEITDPRARLEVTDARTRLHHDLRNSALQLLTVLAVLAGAGLGFQQLAEDRSQASQDRDQAIQDRQLTRQGQASERFTRAIDQLGSSRVETRIGGIYGLDQIAEQSPENTGPVGEVLLAWLNGRPRSRTRPDTPVREHAPDVQAALSVLIGRQHYASIVANRLDLHGLGLRGGDLSGANLAGANLKGADLSDADLNGANLNGADLRDADLRDAGLSAAVLTNADLRGTDLFGALLIDAHLPRRKLDAGLAGGRLHRSGGFEYPATSVPFSRCHEPGGRGPRRHEPTRREADRGESSRRSPIPLARRGPGSRRSGGREADHREPAQGESAGGGLPPPGRTRCLCGQG
jgi:Pentapeptide repeats (8 copies)